MLVCPICKNSVQNFKPNSHVIPEWMYKGADMYDEKGRIVKLDFSDNKKSFVQKGYRGKFICDNCEKQTAKLDSYASRLFKNGNYSKKFEKQEIFSEKISKQNFFENRIEKGELWKGFEFKKIQNFIYSIYLRQHFYNLSKKEQGLFIEKHLSPILELYHSDTIDDKTYPIFILCFLRESSYKLIISPYVDKINGHHVIQFTAYGFYFILKVSSHSGLFGDIGDNFKLKSDGSIYIHQVKPENTEIVKKATIQVRKNFARK